jgi:hypothetical protein
MAARTTKLTKPRAAARKPTVKKSPAAAKKRPAVKKSPAAAKKRPAVKKSPAAAKKRPAVKKSPAAATRPAATKPAATQPAATQPAAKQQPAAMKRMAPRADFGAPIDGFFEKQPAHLRSILEELRAMIEREAPEAESSIKWGMPFFSVGGAMMCALGGHRSHVNLILSGPPDAFDDPDDRLTGEGKTGRHLKLARLDDLPRAAVRGWLRTAAKLARDKSAD